MTIRNRYRIAPKLWLCVECLRHGRRDIYVSVKRVTCPFGHRRKGLKK